MSELLKNCVQGTSVLVPTDLDDLYTHVETISSQISSLSVETDISKSIVKDKYVTKFEVLATSVDIPAGSMSDVKVNFNAMFSNTNQWLSTQSYDKDQIVIFKNTVGVISSSQIYKALNDVPQNTELTSSEYWENITDNYIGLSSDGKFYHKYINDIDASTLQLIELRSSHAIELQNVEIDWGDRTKTYLKNAVRVDAENESTVLANIAASSNDENYAFYSKEDADYEISYVVQHNYLPRMKKDKEKFIITITGSMYWGIGYSTTSALNKRNLISRIWDIDLPFYDECTNTASMMPFNNRILNINLPDYFSAIFKKYNMSGMFGTCKNLQYVNGFKDNTWYNTVRALQNMFINCENLVKCDIRFPHSMAMLNTPINSMYNGCKKLAVDVVQLLPINGFSTRIVDMSYTLSNCISLTISDANLNHCSDVLWNDTSKQWKNVSNMFSTCNSTLKQKVPLNWGGTNS